MQRDCFGAFLYPIVRGRYVYRETLNYGAAQGAQFFFFEEFIWRVILCACCTQAQASSDSCHFCACKDQALLFSPVVCVSSSEKSVLKGGGQEVPRAWFAEGAIRREMRVEDC